MSKSPPSTFLVCAVVLATMVQCVAETSAQTTEYFTIIDGRLERPAGFREWVYVGTPLTPNDMNGGNAPFPEFHSVYIDPDSWMHWKRSGEFRDGAILIKELIGVGSKAAASGNGYFMGEFVGLEAAIKSRKHFPDEPGNWGYFSFSTPDHTSLKASTEAFATETCNACHQSAAAEDWVFTQYYPVLRGGKAAGDDAAGGRRDRLPRSMSETGRN